ncbi:MAG: hypothetical protein QOD36_4636 [Mycobacterium sp.]|nr:hypothetical protein [Mycobacterium sp.]
MAEKFDVASRLAEGRPAVDNIQTYVWACHVLGYANPDLTLHASQISDWYGSEEGLDLRALDADCAALEAAVAATEDALTRQNDQLGALSVAWQGRSADLSREFLHRHGDASAAAAAAVRTTADALATLRDNLWHTVDGKVAAAVAAEGRAPEEWLAAAQTVTTGAGDRAAASERIDQEVKPFVDNDIRTGWLAAMRSAITAVTDSYDAATAELTAEPDAVFEVPGELGPSWTPPARVDEAATVPAAANVVSPPVAAPPSWGAPATPSPMPMPMPVPAPVSAAPAPLPPVDTGSTAPAMAAPPSAPTLGGLPDVGGGLSGLGQQLADAFGSLLGSVDGASAEPPAIDQPDKNGNVDGTSDDNPKGDGEPVDPAAEGPVDPAADKPAEEPVVEPADTCERTAMPAAVEPPTEPAPTPVPEPPPPESVAPLGAEAAAETPCEIAADELPQVGK